MEPHKRCKRLLKCLPLGLKVSLAKKKFQPKSGALHDVCEEKSVSQTGDTCTSGKTPSEDIPSADKVQNRKVIAEEKLKGLQIQTLTVDKCSTGYGFTVKNTCPVRVGRVKPGGAAELAGLLKSDYIIRLNGQNVSRSSAQSVVRIVRHSPHSLVVDFCRKPQRTYSHRCQRNPEPRRASVDDRPGSTEGTDSGIGSRLTATSRTCFDGPDGSDIPDENRPPTSPRIVLGPSHLSVSGHSAADSCTRNSTYCNQFIVNSQLETHGKCVHQSSIDDSLPSSMLVEELRKSTSTPNDAFCYPNEILQKVAQRSYSKWEPDISVISTSESLQGRHIHSNCDTNFISTCQRNSSKSSGTSSLSSWNRWLETSSGNQNSPWTLHGLSGIPEGNTSKAFDESREMSTVSSERDSPSCRGLGEMFAVEEEFSHVMQCGIQQFSRPLRHGVLSTEQHATLFQNLEKLVALSEYHLRQLRFSAKSGRLPSVDLLKIVYQPRIKLLCVAYKSYIEGLPTALSLLRYLRGSQLFNRFLQKQTPGLSIEDFIRKPLLHLVDICRTIAPVLKNSQDIHTDWFCLAELYSMLTTQCQQENHEVGGARAFGDNMDESTSIQTVSSSFDVFL